MMPLWHYAVKVYAIPGVKEALLKLQDRYHFDVNAVLWCLWCARYGFTFGEDEVAEILGTTDDMTRHTTRPLRTVRVWLASPKVGFPAGEIRRLRDQVLQLELMSEELVLRRLDDATMALGEPNETLDDMATRSEQLFTLARKHVDMPTMIADEDGPGSPLGLFRQAREQAQERGP
ncbi:TIGR02444 family protein [Parvularcula lutaonensis]|uniref:TIGR02444 family protein n=1 Tax=Parvularcula lutaonensis TaxID=491923 RepID=A0ABV7MCI6_9PROT|nr:TIGR02444 family protein [Parvularcula lutaonensis]GGY50365.1 hypothetical protein GCM10007148_18950 [Parvularcula lutaonensis]